MKNVKSISTTHRTGRTWFHFIFILMACFFCQESKAQNCGSYTCLGVWYDLNISLSDPTVNGYFVCTIPVPPEGIDFNSGIIGIGAPYFFNHLGSTVDVYIKKIDLIPDMVNETETFILDFETLKEISAFEPGGSSGKVRCHYHLRLNVRR